MNYHQKILSVSYHQIVNPNGSCSVADPEGVQGCVLEPSYPSFF